MKKTATIPLFSSTIVIAISIACLGLPHLLHARNSIHLHPGYSMRRALRTQEELQRAQEEAAKQYQQIDDSFQYVQTPSGRWETSTITSGEVIAAKAPKEAVVSEEDIAYFDITNEPAAIMVRDNSPTQPITRHAIQHDAPSNQIHAKPISMRQRQPIAAEEQTTFAQRLATIGDGQLVDTLNANKPLQLQQLSAQERAQLHSRLQSLVNRLNQHIEQINDYEATHQQH